MTQATSGERSQIMYPPAAAGQGPRELCRQALSRAHQLPYFVQVGLAHQDVVLVLLIAEVHDTLQQTGRPGSRERRWQPVQDAMPLQACAISPVHVSATLD